MRRRIALQRTIEESRVFQDTLNGLISTLRGGNASEIEGLVRQIQQNLDDEDLVKILHSRMQEKKRGHGLSMDSQIKEEENESLSLGTDDEEEAELSKGLFPVSPGLSRKRPFSTQEGDHSSPPVDPSASVNAGNHEGESLGSRYLPMILKLRNVSDREATHMLHDFRTSPISTEGVATLNLLDRRQSRPHLHVQTGQVSPQKSSSQSRSDDRTTWHPSLQQAKLEHQTPIAKTSSQDQWSNRRSGKTSQV